MGNLQEGLFEPFDDIKAEKWVHSQIRAKRIVRNLQLSEAQAELASELKVSTWTIVNIYRGRIKALRSSLRDAILQHKILFLESQIQTLRDELALSSRMAGHFGHAVISDVAAEIAASCEILAKIRELLNGQATDSANTRKDSASAKKAGARKESQQGWVRGRLWQTAEGVSIQTWSFG